MRVRFHPAAADELVEAAAWYEARQPGLGADLMQEIARAVVAIGEAPATWPRWPGLKSHAADTRRFLLSRFPFGIAHRIEREEVVVVAVAHLRRRPGYWQHR